MLDTTQDMYEKQLEIIFSKTAAKRAEIGVNMIDFAYQTVKNSILAEHSDMTEKELVIEIFKRFYKNDFTPEQLGEIVAAMQKG